MNQQTKIVSMVEVCINVFVGFWVSFLAWPFIAAYAGYEYDITVNLGITSVFTVLSVLRGYVIRRWFAVGLHSAALKIARKGIEYTNRFRM